MDFLRTLGEALYNNKEPQHAEEMLLKAFDLSTANPNPQDAETIKVVQLLIQLYEAWNKSEKANEWRAKLEQIEDLEE